MCDTCEKLCRRRTVVADPPADPSGEDVQGTNDSVPLGGSHDDELVRLPSASTTGGSSTWPHECATLGRDTIEVSSG